MNQHARVEDKPIPFIDVAAQRRRLGSAIDDAVARVLAHCQFIQGPEVRALEAELAAFCGARHVIGDLLTLQVTECFGFQSDGSYSMRHLSVGYAEPLRSELAAFVSAIRTGQPPAVTGEEALASLEIAIRCLDSRSADSLSAQPVVPQRKGPRRVVG